METFTEYWAACNDREAREQAIARTSAEDVAWALNKEQLEPADFLTLLSPAAAPYLENMAQRAKELTNRYFGRAVNIFTPLYISDVCTNHCRYCGFKVENKQKRTHLTVDEAYQEALAIWKQGFQDILLLTGEAPGISTPEYIASAVRRIKPLFASIGIEVYSLTDEQYALMVNAGVNNMTMFQETYNPELYKYLHPAGPKSVYEFRLDAPERAGRAGMRSLGLGALLGALAGAWLGCFLAELAKGRPGAEACRAAVGCMAGRFLGTVCKLACGGLVLAVTAQCIWPDPASLPFSIPWVPAPPAPAGPGQDELDLVLSAGTFPFA